MAGPLAGVRIADFTVHAAGPFCTHMLAQLGAEVIKVESAQRPDIFRKPHPVYGRLGAATFDQVASAKLSVRLNLKHPRGIELAKHLVAQSDIAAESFRPGVMTRLGLGYDALRAVKQDIVMLSVSASGQSGPDSHFAGYAPLFGAWGGLGWLTGYPDGPPVEMRHAMDHSVGLHAAMAAVAALHRRRRTGDGSHVDVCAREVAAAAAGDALIEAAAGGTPRRWGNAHPRMAPHGVYPARDPDSWLTIAVADERAWLGLLSVMGRRDLAGDPRFATEAARHAVRIALDAIVADWTRLQDAEEAAALLQQAGCAAHPSWDTPHIAADPHLRARAAIVDTTEPDGTMRAAVGVPVRLSATPPRGIWRGTPQLGEDEDRIFGDLLGLDVGARRSLEAEGAIL
ncbi:CoA transferase [Roseomonas eburnea]|uniref:CoA transferase n=1 Tax=Neoroseomonas eburnea TaxID=1346889 RepID=A0A9X9XB36_9PROT|nr:CoA transferase [Neoroseomonas eburnea]MBR0680922.1 CoA transferase [Neoroseomonas eburnea]